MKLLRQTLVSFLLLTLLTGLLYPLAMTGIAQALFPHQANGSLITKDNTPTSDETKAIGSSLIGQQFTAPRYFWPRPSATTTTGGSDPLPYNAAQSTGSNLGPTNPALLNAIKSRADALEKSTPPKIENQKSKIENIPVDLVTASASGLDPDESPAAALYQAPRIAHARKVPLEKITALINAHTTSPLLGEPTINVLTLNLALDKDFPQGNP
ncbi:MAG: potassium-transporting ATPase subunit KdpC [Phycisphaerae bacterium]